MTSRNWEACQHSPVVVFVEIQEVMGRSDSGPISIYSCLGAAGERGTPGDLIYQSSLAGARDLILKTICPTKCHAVN